MGRRAERWGFSRRVGLGFSGTTATARLFDPAAAAPAPGTMPLRSLTLYPMVDKWSGPVWRRDSGRRSKKNGKGAAEPAAEVGRASHPPLNTRQWGRPFKASPLPSQQVVRSLQGGPQVVFAGQSKVVPIAMPGVCEKDVQGWRPSHVLHIFSESNSLKESNFIPKLDSSLFQDVETIDNVAFQRSGINQRGCFHPCLTNNYIWFLEPAQDPALFPDKVGPISPPRVECFHQINWVISNGVLWPFRKIQD